MANNRGANVQDSYVIERRLRPIYDWLDAGSYKKAMQECDKVLKKSNLQRVRALKALAMLRMGREAECQQALNALLESRPTEDATLQPMSMCYRELQQLDQVCTLYEQAVKEDPTNEELHSHLFMSYVRMSNFKAQQQAAMALYKLQPKKPYYCWAIMSIILQAQRGEDSRDEKKRTLLLSLAERMVDKMIQENKMETEPVQLYIIILEALRKYDKIIEVVDGPLGAKLTGELTCNKLPYLIKLNQWAGVNIMCKKLLYESMDRWDVWKHYIESVFRLRDDHNGLQHSPPIEGDSDDAADDTPEKAHEFICKLVESGSALRGPYLARFELARQLQAHSLPTLSLLGDTSELVIEYFRKFGQKPCCVGDLRVFLSLLPPEKRVELGGRLVKEVGITATSVPASEAQMQRHIGALLLARLCGAHAGLQREHAMALVTAFACHYTHGRQSFGMHCLPTEPGPSDAYIILAAHLLYDIHVSSGASRPLVLALVLLRDALKNSPSNFHIKLLMLRLYHIVGCCTEAHGMYESLDIKHLQLDSMCHVHCAQLAATGHYAIANTLFDTTLKFFSSNYKDSSEHLTFSYKFGSFLKLGEFMDFRERMNNSFHYTSVAVDKMFLALDACASVEAVLQLDTIPRDHPVQWQEIRNNSDLSVYITYDPPRVDCHPEEWPENITIYEQDLHLLKLRVSVLYCINSALQLVKRQEKNTAREQLASEILHLQQLQSEIEGRNYQVVKQTMLCVNFPSRLMIYQQTAYHRIVLNAFRAVLALENSNAGDYVAAMEEASKGYANLAERVVEMLRGAASNGKRDEFAHNRTDIQTLCAFVEVTSIVVLVVLVANEMMAPTAAAQANRRRRQQQVQVEKEKEPPTWRDAPLHALVTAVRAGVRDVEAALEPSSRGASAEEEEEEDEVMRDVVEKLATLNVHAGDEEALRAQLRRSNETAAKEVRAVLKNKLKLLPTGS